MSEDTESQGQESKEESKKKQLEEYLFHLRSEAGFEILKISETFSERGLTKYRSILRLLKILYL